MDPDTQYIKIDDDLVYIKDDALDLMVEAYLEHRFVCVGGWGEVCVCGGGVCAGPHTGGRLLV